jgi:hypothetical protein
MAWLKKQSLLKQHTNVCLNTPYFDIWLEKQTLFKQHTKFAPNHPQLYWLG